MKNWFKTLTATCAVIPFAQCAMLPGGNVAVAAETTAPAAPVAPATTDADPALWVMKDEDTTIYLFGTVHVLKPGLNWFDEAVKDAFDTSDQLMLEVILPEEQAEMVKATLPLALDQTGKTLPSRLAPDDLKAYRAALTSLGVPPAQFDAFEPWFAAITLSVLPLTRIGYDPEQGAEKQLSRQAAQGGKPVLGFETLEEQLTFFDSLPEDAQVAFLNAVVRDIGKLGPMLDRMVGLWRKGDPEGLAVAMNESMAAIPELADILLYQRNARWAERLEARMDQPGTLFVAVGAGHLAGEKSVQDYLKDRGLTVQRIDY